MLHKYEIYWIVFSLNFDTELYIYLVVRDNLIASLYSVDWADLCMLTVEISLVWSKLTLPRMSELYLWHAVSSLMINQNAKYIYLYKMYVYLLMWIHTFKFLGGYEGMHNNHQWKVLKIEPFK